MFDCTHRLSHRAGPHHFTNILIIGKQLSATICHSARPCCFCQNPRPINDSTPQHVVLNLSAVCPNNFKLNPLSSLRSLSRLLHLWLGLTLGVLLALLGLTGAALVFYIEIDSALHPIAQAAQVAPAADWDSPVWNNVLATARREFPDPHGEWSFEVNGEGGAIPARFYPSQEHLTHHSEREMVWFAADGQQVLRSEPWGEYLMSWLYELHMHLLAGETGTLIVGWGGLATLLILISGLVSWWPRGSWRKALSFKSNAVSLRRLRDLHKLGGLWSLPLLLLLVFTGFLLTLPDVKQQLFTALIVAPDPVPQPRSMQSTGEQIPLTQALAIGHAALPTAQLAFIDVPGAGDAPIRLRLQMPGDPHRRFPGSFVFVDQYTGQVLAVHDNSQGNTSTTIGKWIRPIHDGSILGVATRVLAIVLGLLPTAMLITGFVFWQQRRRRQQLNTVSITPTHRT